MKKQNCFEYLKERDIHVKSLNENILSINEISFWKFLKHFIPKRKCKLNNGIVYLSESFEKYFEIVNSSTHYSKSIYLLDLKHINLLIVSIAIRFFKISYEYIEAKKNDITVKNQFIAFYDPDEKKFYEINFKVFTKDV